MQSAHMQSKKLQFAGLATSLVLTLVLCFSLWKQKNISEQLDTKLEEISGLQQELNSTREGFDTLKRQFGQLQNEARAREGDLLRQIQSLSSPSTPPAEPPPAPEASPPRPQIEPGNLKKLDQSSASRKLPPKAESR